MSHKKWRLRDQTSTIDVVLLGEAKYVGTLYDYVC